MVVTESDMMSHEEIESPLQHDQQPKINPFSSLPRQSSIYSLTLDEFQHTLCESGRNFGSMNMDEFLNSIWTAEENQAHVHTQPHILPTTTNTNDDYNGTQLFALEGSTNNNKPIGKQLSLSRQGSLTLPAPLCRKTVDEVWSEIHRTREQQSNSCGGVGGGGGSSGNKVQNQGSAQRQPTFGEMTLEDFLVKAGVVREQQCNLSQPPQPTSQYGMFPNTNFGPGFGHRPVVGNIPPYQPLAQHVAEPVTYNEKRNGGYQTGPPPTMPAAGTGGGYGGRVGSGYGLGGSPVSPQSDGMGGGDGANQYGTMDMRGGRKRIIDGPVEKVVERRQRRMIKNRESAARSRARKQAYTVELEAELNQLKDENSQLKHALAELERKRKQQIWCNLMVLLHMEYFEAANMKAQTKAQKTKERIRMMRRSFSCPV